MALCEQMYFICGILFAIFLNVYCNLYCKDDNGNNVDWFIVYKLPKTNQKVNSFLNDGFKYAYISGPPINGHGASKGWILSEKSVGDVNSIFGNTLTPVYLNPNAYTVLQYNDAPPNARVKMHLAHAKGCLAMDASTGFWLTHSIPNFPPAFDSKNYEYPSTGMKYGQTALCISFKTDDTANTILNHLLTLRPNIYYHSHHRNIPADESVLTKLFQKRKTGEDMAQYKIKSVNGVLFNTFSKNVNANLDLYHEFVAPALKTELLVETWRMGFGSSLPSNCKDKYSVENIHALELHFKNSAYKQEWLYTNDHAKWAVSRSVGLPITCIGDINRMQSQLKRGGGLICVNDHEIWKNFISLVKGIEPCKIENNKMVSKRKHFRKDEEKKQFL